MTVVYSDDLLRLSSPAESSDEENDFRDDKPNHYHLGPERIVNNEKEDLQVTTFDANNSTSSIINNDNTSTANVGNGHNTNNTGNSQRNNSPVHSRDSSLSSFSNLSRKLNINTKSTLPDSINKLSNKFKRNNSVSSSNINIFTRKPSISMKSSESPNSSLHSNSVDDFFDFENINISGSGTLKRINSWSNHLHKNPSTNSNLTGNTNPTTPIAGIASSSASNIFQMKSSNKTNFFANEIENLKFRNRANSSPQQTIMTRKSSISIQNLNLIKKKINNNSNHSFETIEKPANASTNFHATNDISDEYFSKHRIDGSHEFYLDNLDNFVLDLENDNVNINTNSTNSTSVNLNNISINSGTVVASPLTLNSYKFSTPELRCEEFDSSIITINSASTSDNYPDSSNSHQHQQHQHQHQHQHQYQHQHQHQHQHTHTSLGIENLSSAEEAPDPDSPNAAVTVHDNPVRSFPGWSLKDGLLVPNDDSG